jgi:hypothetical protein
MFDTSKLHVFQIQSGFKIAKLVKQYKMVQIGRQNKGRLEFHI